MNSKSLCPHLLQTVYGLKVKRIRLGTENGGIAGILDPKYGFARPGSPATACLAWRLVAQVLKRFAAYGLTIPLHRLCGDLFLRPGSCYGPFARNWVASFLSGGLNSVCQHAGVPPSSISS